jgi:hypothetical protein
VNRRDLLKRIGAVLVGGKSLQAKCEYCGRWAPLGQCPSCGASNQPVPTGEPIDVSTHDTPNQFIFSGGLAVSDPNVKHIAAQLQDSVNRHALVVEFGPRIGFADAMLLQQHGHVPTDYQTLAKAIGRSDLNDLLWPEDND